MASGSRKPRNSCPDSDGKMGFGIDLKKSSKLQQSSKTVFPKQEKGTVKRQDKLKGKSCSGRPYGVPPRELRQSTSTGKHQQESVDAKTTRDDELVKHMSNLPGYLQRLDTGDNIQEKAFNVGVLDWSRLERWKGNYKCEAASGGNNFATTTSSNLAGKTSIRSSILSKEVHKEDLSYQMRLHPSFCSGKNLPSSRNDADSLGANPSNENVLQFQNPEISSRSKLDGDKMVSAAYKSFSKNDTIKILEKGKGKGLDQSTCSTRAHQFSNSRYGGIPVKPKDYPTVCDGENGKRDDAKRKAWNQKVTSSAGASSSMLNLSSSSKENKNVGDAETIKTREVFQDPSIGCTYEHQRVDGRNIVLLLPRKFSKVGSSEFKPRTSLDRNFKELEQNSFSGSFCNSELPSSGHCSEYSCPLSSREETDLELLNEEHTAFSMQSTDQSYDASHTSACTHKMPTSLSVGEVQKNSVISTNVNGTYKTLNQETAELAARKSRHPSPNRRFSFSLSRMTRSFSFKENSSVPQLSSTYVSAKSGPVTPKAFACSDDSNKEKASVNNRARASPLRRILDPLLKSRSSSTLHSSQADKPMKGNSDYLGMAPFVTIKSLQNEKHDKSVIRARLQLMMKNGLPLFRLAVNNNSSILAATKMNVAPSVKNDSGCGYMIYAIEEIKKRSGSWISQPSKEKSCGYVYNVVGQMKINGSSSFESSEQYPANQYKVKESVLFGAEPRQEDQVSPKFMPGRELAAIVARTSNGTQRLDQLDNRWHCNLQGDDHSNSTTVILPGGIHSLPEKGGGPSPLIQRWKSGGSCDCGGWDIGCKLHILSNESGHFQSSKTSNFCPTSDHLELFLQGEAQNDEPVFSMTLLEKGLYSINFSPSISLLQAFFICITMISCQTSSDLAEVENLSVERVHQRFRTANEREEKLRTVKYAPSPPFSPVGRV